MMSKCLVRGSINADEYFHVKAIARPGETISSYNFQTKPGGKGANQAVAVAKAGGPVEFVGAVGPNGQWLIEELIRHGVSVGGLVKVEEQTGRALIQVAEDGENSIVLHHGANHATLPPPRPSIFTGVSHLLLQNEIPLESTIEYLSTAYSHNVISVMNPSPTPPAADIQRFPWGKLSWLIINQGEASSLLEALGSGDSTFIPELPEDWPQYNVSIMSAYKTVFRLASLPLFGPHVNIVCTLGALGALALIPSINEPVYLPAAKLRGPVVDTTGAGDCFAGYLVAGLMELNRKGEVYSGENALTKDDFVQLLRHCVQAAGLCVQRRGTIDSIPARDEVVTELQLG